MGLRARVERALTSEDYDAEAADSFPLARTFGERGDRRVVASRVMSGLKHVRPSRRLVASAVASVLALSSCTGPGPPPPAPPVAGGVAILPLRLAKVTSTALKGRPARGPLIEPAEQIRQMFAAMYTAGFLDPAQWQAGFPAVLDAFAPDARKTARDDLNQLTLGGSARSLSSARPTESRIVIRFLPNERRRPVAAVADMRFEGIGSGAGFEIPIRHGGEYVLRQLGDRWLIVGYQVRGRVGS